MSPAMVIRFRCLVPGLVLLVTAALWPLQAHALFSDDEARKAIIELRQRVENNRQAAEASYAANAQIGRAHV